MSKLHIFDMREWTIDENCYGGFQWQLKHNNFPVIHRPCMNYTKNKSGKVYYWPSPSAFYSKQGKRAWCRRCQKDVPAGVMFKVLTSRMI